MRPISSMIVLIYTAIIGCKLSFDSLSCLATVVVTVVMDFCIIVATFWEGCAQVFKVGIFLQWLTTSHITIASTRSLCKPLLKADGSWEGNATAVQKNMKEWANLTMPELLKTTANRTSCRRLSVASTIRSLPKTEDVKRLMMINIIWNISLIWRDK